jgi:copper chaperone NosL
MKRLALLVLIACARGLEPSEPVWGKEPCAHCMMLVSERQSAAQLVLSDGTRRFFDDIGCMVSYLDHEQLTARAQWVHLGDGWVRAEDAHYARAATPMDFGFIAAGDGVGFEAVKTAVRAKGREAKLQPESAREGEERR